MSFKPVQRKREKKTTHFAYTVDFQPLPSPHPPHTHQGGGVPLAIPSVKPGQDPLQRRVPSGQVSAVSNHQSEDRELHISTEAVRKLQEIIEAQKSFLKYQEMREILQSKHVTNKHVTKNSGSKKDQETVALIQRNTGNIIAKKVRKEAKRIEPEEVEADIDIDQAVEQNQKSAFPVSDLAGDQEVPEKSTRTTRSAVISPLVSTSVQTSAPGEEIGAEAAAGRGPTSVQTQPASEKTVKCDWAYWYVPDSNTHRSKIRGEQADRNRSKTKDKLVDDERPWRKGMKKVQEKEPPVVVDVNLAEKSLPEKPWRSNMRTETKKPEPHEEQSKPKLYERAWRTNMKKEQTRTEPSEPPPKKRHYDRKEVLEYMKAKRAKEKELQEAREKEQELRKEVIKRRLNELDKLQKQITEADLKEYRRMGQAEKHLSEKGQELLRQKLMELTEQMKAQWKERQERNLEDDNSKQMFVVEEDIRLNSVNEKPEGRSVSDFNIEVPFHPETTSSISEVSDATEFKSLFEIPTRSDRLGRRKSKQWTDNSRNCNNATPLTDEIPERDLSDGLVSKSQQLRKLVGEVFSRHQSDLEFIRNTVKDIDLPEEPVITPVTQFVPRFPTVITTLASLPDLEQVARPVPHFRTSRLISGDQLNAVENGKLGGWMNTTRETDTTEFRDLPDRINTNNQNNECENFTIPANLSSTVYVEPPVALPKSNILDHLISTTQYAEPPVTRSQPTQLDLENQGTYRRDNLSHTQYLDLPQPDNLSRTEYAHIGTEAPASNSVPSDMAISEGALTPSPTSHHSDSSIATSYAGVIDCKSYSKKQTSVGERRRKKQETRSESDSQSTLKGGYSIKQNSPRLKEDLLITVSHFEDSECFFTLGIKQ